jgi:FlaA1/EpsC-like NDP-sugar epimerase
MLFVDISTLLFALWLAFVLRLGEPLPLDYIYDSLWIFITIPIITIPIFIRLGLYRSVLQYIGVKVITTTFQATTISCLIIGFLMMFFRESNLPRSVLPIFWFIINVFVMSTRFLFKEKYYLCANCIY